MPHLLTQLTLFAAETVQKASDAAHGAEVEHAAEEAEGIAQLGIDPIAIVLQLGTFLILFLVIRRFALEKVVGILDDRRKTIDESLINADLIEQQKENTEVEVAKQLNTARSEADEVIAKSHEEAGAIVADAEAKATKRAEEIVANAKLQAEQERRDMAGALKKELLGYVAQATELVLDEKVDGPKDQQLIKKALSEAGADV